MLEALAKAQQSQLDAIQQKTEVARLTALYRSMPTADLMADYSALMAEPQPAKYQGMDTDQLIELYFEEIKR
jgi:hypothetical protein